MLIIGDQEIEKWSGIFKETRRGKPWSDGVMDALDKIIKEKNTRENHS